MKNFYKRGFTLIELLVVIAIIGLLASIVLVSLSTTRVKTRDAKRKAELSQMMITFEMFYDIYGYYPNPGGRWCHSNNSCWDTLENELKTDGLVSKLPRDPINNSTGSYGSWYDGSYSYTYIYDTPGTPQHYDLIAKLENENDSDRCQVKCYRNSTLEVPDASFCRGGNGLPLCPAPAYDYGGTSNYIYSARQLSEN